MTCRQIDLEEDEKKSEMMIGIPRDCALERSILELANCSGWLRMNLNTGEVHVMNGDRIVFKCRLVAQHV
jgi:hypothetical protein